MNIKTIQKIGGITIIIGALLLILYSILFFFVLPFNQMKIDFSKLVLHNYWILTSFIAFIGLLLLIYGYLAIYTKIYSTSGLIGLISIVLIEIAYLLQIIKVSWEIFLYPIICNHLESIFLINKLIIISNPLVKIFNITSSLTILAGIILFSLVIFKSKVYSKISAIFICLGAIMYGGGPFIGAFVSLIGILIFAIGCVLISKILLKS